MVRYCDRCGRITPGDDLTKVHLGPDIARWICPECETRLYHWFKMECHRYGCDEVMEI